MSSRQHLDALAAARAHNATLRKIILLVAGMGVAGMYFAYALPKNLELHLSPNMMNAGDSVQFKDGRAPVPETNVYGFAYYVWQQLNRWPTDGYTDYGKQIYRFQHFITPACMAQLDADLKARHAAYELRERTRQITEIPGLGYTQARVIADGKGDSAWTVLLDMQLMETFKGAAIKDTYIRYPIRVVRYDVDRMNNPWRLAIDCYGSQRPQRLKASDVTAAAEGQKTLPLPDIAPVALPRAVDAPAAATAPAAEIVPSAPAAPDAASSASAATPAASSNLDDILPATRQQEKEATQ